MSETIQVTTVINRQTYDQIKIIAKLYDVSYSKVMKALIEGGLEHIESVNLRRLNSIKQEVSSDGQ